MTVYLVSVIFVMLQNQHLPKLITAKQEVDKKKLSDCLEFSGQNLLLFLCDIFFK